MHGFNAFVMHGSTKDRQSTVSSAITAGFTSSVDILLTIENSREDAFQSIISFELPTDRLELVNIFNQTKNGEVLMCHEYYKIFFFIIAS